MFQEHGTKVLVTNPLVISTWICLHVDKKYGQWCGGKEGWDDYTERYTEKPDN